MVITSFEDIKPFLPTYLSEESLDKLFEGIKHFVNDRVDNLYTTLLSSEKIIFQGDALSDIPFVSLPDSDVINTKVLVISNTCDLDQNNQRNSSFPIHISYVPIISMNKYLDILRESGISEDRITSFVSSLKRQQFTHILYFPAHPYGPGEEVLALLDRTCNCDAGIVNREKLNQQRIFTLNNFGFYLLLLKLSIHFSRIRENIDRDVSS